MSASSGRFGIRIGEALVAGGPPGTAAEPEVAIGEMDGPFGTAFATLLGDQTKGHSKVLSLLNTDVMVRPPTLCVSKVTVENERYTNILMGTVQYATSMGVLDAVRSGDLPRDKVDDLGIIVSVWLNPSGKPDPSQSADLTVAGWHEFEREVLAGSAAPQSR